MQTSAAAKNAVFNQKILRETLLPEAFGTGRSAIQANELNTFDLNYLVT